jgi:hypothetical protein
MDVTRRGATMANAPEIDAEKVLADYDPNHRRCRVDRHPYGQETHYRQTSTTHARRYKTCTNCGSKRWAEVEVKTGYRTGKTGYDYVPGYLTPGTGLQLSDFQETEFLDDFTRALKEGRVEFEPGVVTSIQKKSRRAS